MRFLFILFFIFVSFDCLALDSNKQFFTEDQIKQKADSILTLMSFTVLPDITTSNLTFGQELSSSGKPELFQSTLGGGFTVSREVPVYLEGTLGYSRYDPKFIYSDGTDARKLPGKWNSVSATGGIGYDFPITENQEWKLRPIFNFSLGRVITDSKIAQEFLNNKFPDLDLDIIDGGKMNAYGLGGSIMLDWEHYLTNYEIDLELRYSNIQLRTFGDTTSGLKGESETNSAGLWARYRAPTGITFLDAPLRYVLETSFTSYYGDQRDALGFSRLGSVGAGIEIDSSEKIDLFSRTRILIRYVFGENVSGTSLGLAISF